MKYLSILWTNSFDILFSFGLNVKNGNVWEKYSVFSEQSFRYIVEMVFGLIF